jgi:flavin reductase (DIM6/NTAB) family NADH-FMN oxidoreductase RutF
LNVDLSSIEEGDRYRLLVSSILPRPIALTTSMDAGGRVNAAPYSFFNVMTATPPLIVMGINSRANGTSKDTLINIRETEQFVVNLVNEDMAQKMNVCAIDFPSAVDEISMSGFTPAPSIQVKPPRIAESPVNLECVMHMVLDVGSGSTIIIGRVVHYHIHDDLIDAEKLHIAADRMHLIGRMHGRGWYTRTDDLFLMERLTQAGWRAAESGRDR